MSIYALFDPDTDEGQQVREMGDGIKKAPVVIRDPARNAIVYVTSNKDKNGSYVIVAFDINNKVDGGNGHRATTIHPRERLEALIDNLGSDATILIKNENTLNKMLPGNQILKSLELLANVEHVEDSISQASGDVKGEFSISENGYADYDKPITVDDIRLLREITKAHGGERVSINEFTSEDIQKAQKWAIKFYKELGTNSPFFRAWFGDWRQHDNKSTNICTKIENAKINTKSRNITNGDTKWNINISNDVISESVSNSDKQKPYVLRLLGQIDEVMERAILLDTAISENSSKNKKATSQFMHYFYSIVEYNGNPFLAKIDVEEYGTHGTSRRAYNLARIKMSSLSRKTFNELKVANSASNDDGIIISDLFGLVKTYDKSFKPKPVNPAMMNEDGTPRVFYHGTRDTFSVFDKEKRGNNTKTKISRNWFFAADKETANSYYPYGVMEYLYNKTGQEQYNPEKLPASRRGNLYELYISARNPLVVDISDYDYAAHRENADAWTEHAKQADRDGNDAIILLHALDNQLDTSARDSTVVLFRESSQAKSATDNIGTFDRGNDDIRYSLRRDESIEEKNIKNGIDAIKKIVNDAKEENGMSTITVKNAMYRSDIGYIDFRWGFPGKGEKFKNGWGISHIIAKRDAENKSGLKTVFKLVEVIAKSTTYDLQNNGHVNEGLERIRLFYKNYTAVLVKEKDKNNWLLTGWESNKKTDSFATDEGYDSFGATDNKTTLTRLVVGDDSALYNNNTTLESESQVPSENDFIRRSIRDNIGMELREALSNALENAEMSKADKDIIERYRHAAGRNIIPSKQKNAPVPRGMECVSFQFRSISSAASSASAAVGFICPSPSSGVRMILSV